MSARHGYLVLGIPVQSERFSSVLGLRGTAHQFQTVLLPVTTVHPPHERGQHLEVFCMQSAGVGSAPAASQSALPGMIIAQLSEFRALSTAWRGAQRVFLQEEEEASRSNFKEQRS